MLEFMLKLCQQGCEQLGAAKLLCAAQRSPVGLTTPSKVKTTLTPCAYRHFDDESVFYGFVLIGTDDLMERQVIGVGGDRRRNGRDLMTGDLPHLITQLVAQSHADDATVVVADAPID